jgi:hypothetical protein
MEKKELEKLLTTKTKVQIVDKYIFGEITLTERQLDKILSEINKENYISLEELRSEKNGKYKKSITQKENRNRD